MKIDINRRTFAVANTTGGMSGPADETGGSPHGLPGGAGGQASDHRHGRHHECGRCDRIHPGRREQRCAVGTANFHNPYATVQEIVKGIEAYMEKYGIEDIHELIGAVR